MQDIKGKLEQLLGFLAKYETVPKVGAEEVEQILQTSYVREYYDEKAGLFTAQVLTELKGHKLLAGNRLTTTADWWFDDELDYGFREKLALRENVLFVLPETPEQEQVITVVSGEDKVKVRYADTDLTRRFRFGIGIHSINCLLEKMGSELQLVEITDRGEDFAAYAVVLKKCAEEFREGLARYLIAGEITDYQKEIEKRHNPVID